MANLLRFFRLSSRSTRAYAVFLEPFGDFSTTEQDTGLLWIDGKTIFRKVVDTGALPNAALKQVAHGIVGIGTLISMRGAADNGAGVVLTLPNVNTASTPPQISLVLNGDNLDIVTGTDRTSFTTSFVILDYTKA